MNGFVWMDELFMGKPSGAFTKRFVMLWPTTGAQYFAQEPLEVDPHKLKALDNPDGGWICGGSIEALAINVVPKVSRQEIIFFPFTLSLRAGDCNFELQLALESEEERSRWIEAFTVLIKSLIFSQVCVDCDQALCAPVLQALSSPEPALRLHSVQLNSKMLRALCRYYAHPFASAKSLQRLELVNANLTDSHANLLADLLALVPQVQELSLAENFLTSKGMKIVSDSLFHCVDIHSLDLSNNLIADSVCEPLCKALARMTSLFHLSLSRNRFSDALVDSLKHGVITYKSCLRHLDLSYNALGDALAPIVVTLLQNVPSSLVSLDLSFTGMADAAFLSIAEVLPCCSTLRLFSMEGAFLEPATMRALIVAVMQHHQQHAPFSVVSSAKSGPKALEIKFGGMIQDVNISNGLHWKALKLALAEIQEPAILQDLVLRRPSSFFAPSSSPSSPLPIICLRMALPGFLDGPDQALWMLSDALACEREQLQILSCTTTCTTMALPPRGGSGGGPEALTFVMFTILPSTSPQALRCGTILCTLLKLVEASSPALRLLGIRSVYVQYTRGMLQDEIVGEIDPSDTTLLTVNQAIRASGSGGRGGQDWFVPAIAPIDVYSTEIAYSEWTPHGVEEDMQHVEHAEGEKTHREDASLLDHGLKGKSEGEEDSPQQPFETMSQVFARESKVREEKAGSERLVLAVRRLYAAHEISSSVAKFWEGVLGHRKYRSYAEMELLQAMKSPPWLPPDPSDVVATSVYFSSSPKVTPEEVVVIRDALRGLPTSIYPAVAVRQVLYDSLFARDIIRLEVVLKVLPSPSGGQAYALGQKLVGEIVSLQNTFLNIKSVAQKYADLPVVEDFLLQCGRLAYAGPEMFQAVELRQMLVSRAIERGETRALGELNKIKSKALLTNLLISRDLDSLRAQTQVIRLDGQSSETDISGLPEFQMTETIVKLHSKIQRQLKQAIEGRSLDALDAALALAAFHYIYCPEVDEALAVVSEISRNPAVLLRRIVVGLRSNDMPSVERGFDELSRMGIAHMALDTVTCSKIYAIKNRIVQDDAVKDKVVKLCLALRNGLVASSAEIAQVYRKALSLGLDKDPAFSSYFSIISKFAKKLAGVFKQEQFIADLLEQQDTVRLNKLLCGRGAGKLVISFPTAFARDQWSDKLRDVCSGRFSSASPNTIIYTGLFEKAARSNDGIYKGWRRRYFVLSGTHVSYYTRAQGELKGSMRILGGAVRVMHPRELNPQHNSLALTSSGDVKTNYSHRLYCLEIEEGRDISNISLDLMDEVKKHVRLAKILKIEQLVEQGIAYRSMAVLTRMLAHAQSLEVMVNYKLMTSAKQCLLELKERNLKAELYYAGRLIPKNYILKDLLQSSKDYQLDAHLPSLVRIQSLLSKPEVEQDLLRAWRLLSFQDIDGFIRAMRKVTKLDWSMTSLQFAKTLFVNVFIRFVGMTAHRLHTCGHARGEIMRIYKHALLLCSTYHVETEMMDLVRLAMKFLIRNDLQEAGSMALLSPASPGFPLAGAGGDRVVGEDAGGSHNDIQSFIEEIANAIHSTSQFSINKYPHLRSSVDHLKGSKSFSFFTSKNKMSRRKSALAVEVMSFTASPLSKSLLVMEGLDSSLCIEAFAILQVLMTDRPATSLPRPGKGKVVKSQGNTPTTLLFDLLLAMNSHPHLVDECYFQVCKQLTGNENWTSCAKGWLVLCVYLLAVAPSATARPFLQHFIAERVKSLKLIVNDERTLFKAGAVHADGMGDVERSKTRRGMRGEDDVDGEERDDDEEEEEGGERGELAVVDVDSVVVNQMGYSTGSTRYCLRAAQYAQFLLSRYGEGASSKGEAGQEASRSPPLPLSPAKQDILPLLECLMGQVGIDVDIVLMTGVVVSVHLPFSQLSTPSSLLIKLFEVLVPPELRRFYANRQREETTLGSMGGQLNAIDQQLMNSYDSLFDPNYLAELSSVDSHSNRSLLSSQRGGWSEEETERQALHLFRNFGLFRIDSSALTHCDEEGHATVNLLKLPVQPIVGQMLSWDHDLQFELLDSFAMQRSGRSHHKLERMERPLRKFVLRNILISPSTERFSDDYEMLHNEFSPFDQSQRLRVLREWLSSDPSMDASNRQSLAPAQSSRATLIRREDALVRTNQASMLTLGENEGKERKDGGRHATRDTLQVLPMDFVRLDLIFAEETRYVNSHLALLSTDQFHYLLAMQLAISWTSFTSTSLPSEYTEVQSISSGIASCYRRLPLQAVQQYNRQKDYQLVALQNSLEKSGGRRGGGGGAGGGEDDSSEEDSSDSDEQESVTDAQRFHRLQQKYDQLHRTQSRYSPRRLIQRKKYLGGMISSHGARSAIHRHSEGGRDPRENLSDEDYLSQDEDDDFTQLKGIWRPRSVAADQALSAEDLQHMHKLLDTLGVSYQPSEEEKGETARIDVLWKYLGAFHVAARDAGVSPDSSFFRYVIKRAYHDYLSSITLYCGLHFVETKLVEMQLDASLRFESPELTAYVDKFHGPLSILLAVSHHGIYLCDVSTWEVIFYAPLFDIQQYDILPTGGGGGKAGGKGGGGVDGLDSNRPVILKLFINGLQLGLLGERKDMTGAMQMIAHCAKYALVSLDLHNWSTDGTEEGNATGAQSSTLPGAASSTAGVITPTTLAGLLGGATMEGSGLDGDVDTPLFRHLFAGVYKYKNTNPVPAQQAMMQRFLSQYCPLLPTPPSLETLAFRLSRQGHFQPLRSKRQMLLQQRLESLLRDQALSSLATHARYEKTQEHMHKQSNKISHISHNDDFDDEDGMGGDELQDASSRAQQTAGQNAGDRTSKRKRPVRSIFRDPHSSTAKPAALESDRFLSSITGVVHPQANRFSRYVSSVGPKATESARQSLAAGPAVDLPLRVHGVIQTHGSQQNGSDSFELGKLKPQLRPPLKLATALPMTHHVVGKAGLSQPSVVSTKLTGVPDLQSLLPLLEQQHEQYKVPPFVAREETSARQKEKHNQVMAYVLGLNH